MNSQFGPQLDGSIVDMYGRRISREEKESIIQTVHALPAREKQADFLNALVNNRIVIVQGETGSGKTTQLPKFAHQKNPHERIVVTQPRVLAAKSNAGRVSDELLVETGDAEKYSLGIGVGYRTGPDKNSTRDTRFLFNTDATETLRQAMSGLIPQVLFLDEVHNFSVPTEIVAMLAKRRADAMKIVIMSATLNPEIFREYYKDISTDIPLIEIPGRTFGVRANYDAEGSYMTKMRELVGAKKNILFFAPGKKEIEAHIEDFRREFGGSVLIFPLHSEMPRSEQDKLLQKNGDKPYIIVSTNVAEESITIPYIDAVVDLGTHKVMRYDGFGNPVLNLEDTAYANAKQRAGRAGRTKPGEYSRHSHTSSSEIPKYPEAPIEKEMIDRHILTLLSQGIDIIRLIDEQHETGESPFFHFVNRELFSISLSRLQHIGALTSGFKLTELGYELLKFPVDVYHARMLYEAISRGSLDTVIPLVAILEKKGFLSKDTVWKELLTKESYASDLLGYYELFQIVTSTTLSKKHEKFLIAHGANPEEIADFRERDHGIKLYEVVDLECIGIKRKKVKEIDEAAILLKTHIEGMISENEVEKAHDSKNLKVALASGYMHAIYVYDEKTKKLYNKDQKNGPGFNIGNVSLVEPVNGKLYLGIPFIIGGSESRDDFPILTHLVSIDEISIREAQVKNSLYAQEEHIYEGQSAYNYSTKEGDRLIGKGTSSIEGNIVPIVDTSKQDTIKHIKGAKKIDSPIIVDYELAIHEFQHERHETAEDAQLFYLRYCLVPFLLQRNRHLRNYIAGKDEAWVQYFSMLLRSFLEEHDLYRINPKNIARTEASFRDDADILRRFQDSPDSRIRIFRLRGIPEQVTKLLHGDVIDGTIQIPSPDSHLLTPDSQREQEINKLRVQYNKLIGEAKLYSRPIAIDQLEVFALRKKIDELSNTGVYAELCTLFQTLSGYPISQMQETMKYLKGLRNKKRDENKAKGRLLELEKFEKIFKTEEAVIRTKESVLLDAANKGYFGHMDNGEKQRYGQFIRLIKSSDTRKRKRAMRDNGFPYYQGRLGRHIQAERKELELLRKEISLENFPEASKILAYIEEIGILLYGSDYYYTLLHDGAFDFMRSILRDHITEHKGLDNLLFDGFFRKGCGEHMNSVGSDFKELSHHMDLMETFAESYNKGSQIYNSVMNPHSTEEAGNYVQKLFHLIERMRNSSKIVDKNSTLCTYHIQ